MSRENTRHCDLCGREVELLTRHHLVPQTRHANKRNKRMFSREEVKTRLLWLCSPCHDTIHAVLSEKQLEREYNTREALLAHPKIAQFLQWIAKRPDTRISVKVTRERRRK